VEQKKDSLRSQGIIWRGVRWIASIKFDTAWVKKRRSIYPLNAGFLEGRGYSWPNLQEKNNCAIM